MDERIDGGGTNFEVLLGIFVIIIAMFIYSFFIGNITAMMLRANTTVEGHRLALAQVERYLRRRRVPEGLRMLVRTNMQNAFERGDGKEDEILDKLPRSLRASVLRQINSRVLRRAPLFFRCDRALVGALCSVLRRAVFVSGEVIAREGEVAREMFFLESGRVLQEREEEEEDEDHGRHSMAEEPEESRYDTAKEASSDSFSNGSGHGGSGHGGRSLKNLGLSAIFSRSLPSPSHHQQRNAAADGENGLTTGGSGILTAQCSETDSKEFKGELHPHGRSGGGTVAR